MGAKQRLINQFRWSNDYLALRHDNAWDFYLSCWQSNRSAYPLLCIRIVLFLGALGTVLASLVLVGQRGLLGYWLVYNTQWALLLNLAATGLATAVSAVACIKGPIDSTFKLPWYIRLYWLVYCIAVPVAFFVTIFYYSFLTDEAAENSDLDPVLDLFIHGINSVLMFLLLVTSQQPFYFFQFLFPLAYLIVYMTFSIIFHFAGGTNPFGEPWIYPMLNWADPGPTVGLVFVCIAIIIAITLVTVFLTLLRDYLSYKWNLKNIYTLN